MDLPFFAPASEFLEGPGGLKIHYQRQGSPDRPALLLTPGGAQSLLCWRRQMEPLSQHFQVIAWDTPGHGATLLPRGFSNPLSADIFADAMEAVVYELHLRETGYIAVAWSFGGWITRNFLLKYGTVGLRGIVFSGTYLGLIEGFMTSEEPHMRRSAALMGTLASQDILVRDQTVLAFTRWLTEEALPEEDYFLTLGYVAWTMLNGTPRDLLYTQLPGDAVALLRERGIPALYLIGENDALIPVQVVQPEAMALGAELHICKGGHSPFLEDSDAFNEQVLTFARRMFARSGTPAS